MANYVIVFNHNGVEIEFFDEKHRVESFDQLAQNAFRTHNIRTSRKDPQRIGVKFYELSIEKGQIKRTWRNTGSYQPQLEAMTPEEFEAEEKTILDKFPEAFRGYVSQSAYDRGVRQREIKRRAVEYKGDKCVDCGYNKCLAAMEFHHLDPSSKDPTNWRLRSFEKIKVELDKCVLLCSNCHRERGILRDTKKFSYILKGMKENFCLVSKNFVRKSAQL